MQPFEPAELSLHSQRFRLIAQHARASFQLLCCLTVFMLAWWCLDLLDLRRDHGWLALSMQSFALVLSLFSARSLWRVQRRTWAVHINLEKASRALREHDSRKANFYYDQASAAILQLLPRKARSAIERQLKEMTDKLEE